MLEFRLYANGIAGVRILSMVLCSPGFTVLNLGDLLNRDRLDNRLWSDDLDHVLVDRQHITAPGNVFDQ